MAGRRFTVRLVVPAVLVAACAGPAARAPIPEEIRLDLPAPSVAPTGSRAPELAPLPSRTPHGDTDPHSDTARLSGAGGAAADVQPAIVQPATPQESATAGGSPRGVHGGSEDPAGPVHLPSSLDASQPPPELAAAILGAYTAFWDSYWQAASHPVDPAHPGIARYSTEPLHSRAAGVLLGRATEGIALRLPADHGAGRIIHIEGWDRDGAELLDCFVDAAVLYEVSTGRVRNDEQATVVHLALMRRVGGSWRVAEIFEQAIHTGRTDGCIIEASTRATPGPTGPAPPQSPGGDAGGAAAGQASAF